MERKISRRPFGVYLIGVILLLLCSACRGKNRQTLFSTQSSTLPITTQILTKISKPPETAPSILIPTLTPLHPNTKPLPQNPTRTIIPTPTKTPTSSPPRFSIQPENVSQIAPTYILTGEINTKGMPFSPDGHLLASSSFYEGEYSVLLWNMEDGSLYKVLRSSGNIFAFTPNGSRIAVVAYDTIQMWSVPDFNLLYTRCIHDSPDTGYMNNYILSIAFKPDGTTFVTASNDGLIRFWQTSDGVLTKTLKLQDSSIQGTADISFSPDGKLFAATLDGGLIKIWETQTFSLLRTLIGSEDSVETIAFSPDGKTLAAGSRDNKIWLWNIEYGTLINTLTGHTGWILDIAFSPDSQLLVSSSSDQTVKIWRTDNGKLLQTMNDHHEPVVSVMFANNGSFIASVSRGAVILWADPHQKNIQYFQLMPTQTDLYSIPTSVPTPTDLPTEIPWPKIGQWKCLGNDKSKGCEPIPGGEMVQDFAFATDSELWVVGENGYIASWNGKYWSRYPSPTTVNLRAIAFTSPDNGWITGDRGIILHWNGIGWVVKNPPIVDDYPCCSQDFYTIALADSSNGWIFGLWGSEGGGGFEALQLKGDSWQVRTDNTTNVGLCWECQITSATMISPMDGWAAAIDMGGSGEEGVFHWDGNRWFNTDAPIQYPTTINALSSYDVWASGIIQNYCLGKQLRIVHWDGNTWTITLPPQDLDMIRALYMFSDTDGWAAAGTNWFASGYDDYNNVYADVLLHWNGEHWLRYPAPNFTLISNFKASPNGRLWALADNGILLYLEKDYPNP